MQEHSNHTDKGAYIKLALMVILSFGIMYLFMYAMVDIWGNVFSNYNQLYMAGLMASSMVILEVLLMKNMYESRKWNALILGASIVVLVFFWFGIRQQKGVGDEQFLKSMIPHHASAILMCKQAPIKDEEIKQLCQNIISSQQSEIDFMKAKLNSIK